MNARINRNLTRINSRAQIATTAQTTSAERRAGQDIDRVVVSTDHARHSNARCADRAEWLRSTGNDEMTPSATAIVTAT